MDAHPPHPNPNLPNTPPLALSYRRAVWFILSDGHQRSAHPHCPARPRALDAAKQRIFLAALVDGGSVARAARAAGMSRSSAHRLRLRLAGTPFDHAWERALTFHADRLADPLARPQARPATRPGASQAQR